MENEPQQMEITIMPNEVDVIRIATSLQKMESMVSSNSRRQCCIYKVPEFIGKGKEECYRPLTTSIGPVFYKKGPEIEAMQELKRIYLKSFREHSDNARQSFEPYIEFVKEREMKIRECYQEKIDLPRDDFIQLIVLDSAFVINFLLLSSKQHSKSVDCPSKNTEPPNIPNNALYALMYPARTDLILEENQLPFFVLEGIYDIAFGEVSPRLSFIDLSLQFIGQLALDFDIPRKEAMKSIIDGKKKINVSSIEHLVDLMRSCCCLPFDSDQEHQKKGPFHEFYNAKHLSDAGIEFKLNQSDNLFDIKFDKCNGVLRIPKLDLYDETESILRSILLFEQCHYPVDNRQFSDYITFLDKLIDTVDDVQILVQNEILNNCLGSDELCVDLFNKLTIYMYTSRCNNTFSEESKGLKDYAAQRCNKWKAIFWSKYFNHPWAIISVIAAVILFILTLLQTITGFLQINK